MLPPEAEKKLAEVRASFGAESTDTEDIPDTISPDEVRELMDMVGAFEDEDVRDMLTELFEWIAEVRGYDHWKLTPKQANRISRPMTRMMNSIWQRLLDKLPDIIANWCAATPGAAATLLACGIVVGPKLMKDKRLSAGKRGVQPAPQSTEAPKKPATAVTTAKTSAGPFSNIPTFTEATGD